MQLTGEIIGTALWLFLVLLFIRFVFDMVQALSRDFTPRGPLLVFLEAIYTVTDPPINAVRRILPPVRMGNLMFDLAPLVVLIAIYVLIAINRIIFL